jgi:hypothetical protein
VSLAEDVKLSACGRHPSFFPYVLILFVLFSRYSVCHSSLGEHSLMFCLTCSVALVLYFWAHRGQCAVLVLG